VSEPGATATGLYAQQRLALGTVLANRFRIESVLGVGGMGVVYRASDTALDIPVALKLLRPELSLREGAFERFRQELLTARQVSSPHVVRIHDLADHDGQPFITMDLVEGESLDHRIDREGALPIDDVVRIGLQLARGLAAAHARGVVHRDLKPANVLLDGDGNAYITDFGVARSLASGGLTQSGAVLGTPDYLSPEQARGDRVDSRSDLYALGLIVYEMLAARLPFPGGTLPEVLAQRMLRAPEAVTVARPDTPAWLARLVDRLLRPQPAHRLQSADAVVQAFEQRRVARDWRGVRRTVAGVVIAGVAVAAAAFGLWRWTHPVAPAGIAAVSPLHRLLVVPLQADSKLAPDLRVALDALARDALSESESIAVVDGERTVQAWRQLDPAGTARVDARALQRIVGADRVLQLALAPQGAGWRATARLDGGAQAKPQHADAPTAQAALAQLLRQPALASFAGMKTAAFDAKIPVPALEAFGKGVQRLHDDAPADARTHFVNATRLAPGFSAAWLAQAEAAAMVGDQDAAYDALERGQATARGARVQRAFRAALASLDGDAAAAAAQWRARLAQTPDDLFASLQLARAQSAGGDLDAALATLQALTARDPNDARAWFEYGKAAILQGQAQRAVDDYLVRALVLYKRARNRYGEAETVNALGIGYGRLGQSADAEEQYRKAVTLREAVGNQRGLATSLRNLASVLTLRGRFDEAQATLERARALHRALDDRNGLAAVENEMGLLAEERGDYPAALAAFRNALAFWRQLDHKPGIAQALNDIGFAQYQLGAYDDAQAYLVQSAQAYTALGDQTGRIRTQQNLGQLATARGDWAEASRQLHASLTAAEREQMAEEAAVGLRNLAELEPLQGHIASALEAAQRATASFQQREDVRGEVDAALVHVQILRAAAATAQASKALEALGPRLADASTEQQALASLLRAQLAGFDDAGRGQALTYARELAKRSGVRALQLQIALEAPSHDAAIDREIDTLGNASLRLRRDVAAMRADLARGRADAAASRYLDVLPRVRRADVLEAPELHALGAQALRRNGDAQRATLAQQRARDAMANFQRRVPASLRTPVAAR